MKTKIPRIIPMICLMLFFSFKLFCQNITVNWNTVKRTVNPMSYGVNAPGLFDPNISGDPSYTNSLDTVTQKKGLIRFHGWGMVINSSSNNQFWLNSDGTWNAAKIKSALTPVAKDYIIMIDIPDGPNNTGGGNPDPDLVNNPDKIAAWIASLVKIVNVDNGFKVKYFELPNERESFMSTGQMTTLISKCSKAMKAQDPSILVGGPATSWINVGYITSVVQGCLSDIDFVTCHDYGGDGTNSDAACYNSAQQVRADISSLRSGLNNISGGKYIPIFMDEYNIAWQGSSRNQTNKGAVYDALVMTGVVDGGGDVSNVWHAGNGDMGILGASFQPLYFSNLWKLFNKYFYGQQVSVTTSDNSIISAYAVKDTGSSTYSICIINRTGSQQTVGVTFNGYTPVNLNKYQISSNGFSGPNSTSWSSISSGGITVPDNSVTVLTVSAPTPPPTGITASLSSICSGNSTTLTASGAVTYSWSPSAGLSSTTGAIVTATPTISTTYTVIGTDASNNKTTASIGITVSVAPSKPTIAKDNCNELVSSASGANQWYLNGNIISGATAQTYQPTQNGNYTVQTSNGGCMSALSQVYNYMAIPFSDTASCVNAIVIDGILNEVSWNGTSQNICKVALGTGGGVSSNFKTRWNNQYLYVGVDVTDPTLSNSSATNYQNSAVELFLDMNNGKSATYTAYDFHYIFGWNNPTMSEANNRTTGVNFKIANKTGGYQAEIAIPWTTLLVMSASGTIYGVDAAIDISHTAGTRTGQLVWSGDQNDWQSASNFGISPLYGNCVTTSIGQNLVPQNSFSVYPNPFTTNFTLKISDETVLKNTMMKIYDVCGREVKSILINSNETTIDRGELQNGIYFYSILNNNEKITNGKLIIQ